MGSHRHLVGVAVTLTLALQAGCEYMGPGGTKKQPMPPALVVQNKKIRDEPAKPEAPIDSRGAKDVEIYPPSGTLFGSSGPGREDSPRKPFRAKEGKYTLNFEDADLTEVAKVILGDTLKANYVINPKVTGKVSLQTTRPLADDEMIPTLEMLLKTNGAVLIREGSLYRIEPEAAAMVNAHSVDVGRPGQAIPPGYQLRVVPLRYVGVAEMQKVLEPLMPPKSVIRADESRNLLLLAGSSDELESVLDTIRIFDVDFMRGMSVALFPLKNVEAVTVAEELDKLLTISGKGPLTGMFRLLPIERLQAILVVTPQPRYLDEVQSWIERLDRYNTTKTSNMHVYRVQNVDALELANTLGQIFGQGQGRSRTPGASLAPGMTGSSISGGLSSGFTGGDGGTTGFGGGTASGFGGTSTSGFGGTSTSGFGGTSSSGLGTSTGTGTTGSSFGTGSTTGTGALGTGTGRSGTGGGLAGGGFGGMGTSAQGRGRGSAMIDLGNNMRIVADPGNNALIIMARPQDYRDIEAVIKELDVVPLQVLIDATIVEVTLGDELKYGLQWLFTSGQSAYALNGLKDSGLDKLTDAALAATGPAGFAYAFAGKDMKVLMNALAARNKIDVISSPSLMVLNNQEATINVGDRVPTPTGTTTNTNAANPFVTSTIQYQESGVSLKVRPRVNAGGMVIMDIYQEISTPNETKVGGVETFKFAQRKIQSQVAVAGGDTLALGGLISNRQSNTKDGIPLLNELPWLGSLFGSTQKRLDRTELVVMLTPRVVEKRQDVSTVADEFRRKLTGLTEMYEKTPNPYAAPIPLEQQGADTENQ